jgi:hypothetical protein
VWNSILSRSHTTVGQQVLTLDCRRVLEPVATVRGSKRQNFDILSASLRDS